MPLWNAGGGAAALALTGGTLTGALVFSGTTHAGIALNNLTTVQRDAVSSPATGSLIYNSTTTRPEIYHSAAWHGLALLDLAQSFTAAQTVSVNGALSAPGLSLTGTWITGGTATTTKPYVLIETAGATSTAWSTSGTGLGINAASGFTGLLVDAQVNGVRFAAIDAIGRGSFLNSTDNAALARNLSFKSDNTEGWTVSGSIHRLISSGANPLSMGWGIGIRFASGQPLAWCSGTFETGAPDTFLTRRAAAALNIGAADSASPVAQSLSVQSVLGGTSNTAGVNWTLKGSQGTGTGAGGSIIFQVAPAGGSGSSQNALSTVLTLDSTLLATFGGGIRSAAPAGGTAATWKLGIAASVSPTSPNRTIEIDVGGTIYYVHAKTTND